MSESCDIVGGDSVLVSVAALLRRGFPLAQPLPVRSTTRNKHLTARSHRKIKVLARLVNARPPL
jgi:hypothetical protein